MAVVGAYLAGNDWVGVAVFAAGIIVSGVLVVLSRPEKDRLSSLSSWEAAARHPLLYSIGGAIAVLILLPLGARWFDGESWGFSITVGVLCSFVIFFLVWSKTHPEKPLPPPPPWLEPPPSDDH